MNSRLFTIAALFLASVSAASAQTLGYADAIDRLAASCGKDIDKYCKGVNLGNGRIRNCLIRHQNDISPDCRSTMADVFQRVRARIAAQATVIKICDADIRRVCQGVQPGDGNLLECALKAERALSPKCNQAITDAGWR